MNINDKNRSMWLMQIKASENIVKKARGYRSIVALFGRSQATLFASLLCIGIYPLQSVADGKVVLWNKLGSDSEITNSEVGPGGEKTAGSFTPGPFANFGQAFVNDVPGDTVYPVTFPANSVVSKSKGTISFWAKLNNFPSALFDSVDILTYVPPPTAQAPLAVSRIGFGSNDGAGGGGLFGEFGVATDGYAGGLVVTATQPYYENSQTLDSILGDRTAWHHYAIVWDETGISQLGGRKLYLYLDGNVVATPYYLDKSPWGSIPSGSRIALANFYNITGASVAVDNLIVWDDVKTDFSDRFNENPVGQTFSTFSPSASLKLGPKSHDDSFTILAKFDLGTENDGIDPVSEDVGITFGSFSTIIPAGQFRQLGSGHFTFEGTINKVSLKAQFHVPQSSSHVYEEWFKPTNYSFNLQAIGANLDGTVIPLEVQLTIGGDTGKSKLSEGKALFGPGKHGKHKNDEQWLSNDGQEIKRHRR